MDYRQELAETAQKICSAGKGILAADESTGTIGKRFTAIDLENNEQNRVKYRDLLFTTEGIEQYISGVILFDETARGKGVNGESFISMLQKKGIVPGIKVDEGLQVLPGTDENWTAGITTLDKRTKEYYQMGCRFAKWRAVLKISEENNLPSEQAVMENAWGLARYAAICQMNGLVPIVEPEILSDGTHSIEVCQKVTERVLSAVFRALHQNNVFLEGCLLKPNMVLCGASNKDKADCTA